MKKLLKIKNLGLIKFLRQASDIVTYIGVCNEILRGFGHQFAAVELESSDVNSRTWDDAYYSGLVLQGFYVLHSSVSYVFGL